MGKGVERLGCGISAYLPGLVRPWYNGCDLHARGI